MSLEQKQIVKNVQIRLKENIYIGHHVKVTNCGEFVIFLMISFMHLLGKWMWRYSDDLLDPGFPRKSSKSGLPKHPDCAFFYPPLGKMVLLKGSRYFVLNLETLKPEPYYPRPLSDWKGIPRGLNGALTWPDGKLYFFKEQQYWRFDPGKVRITETGNWTTTLQWIGCQRNSSLENNDLL